MLMKRHRKKALIFMMIFCMVFAMMPAIAFAGEDAEVDAEKAVPTAEDQTATEQAGENGDPGADQGVVTEIPEETAEPAEEKPEAEKPAEDETKAEEAAKAEEKPEEVLPANETTDEAFDAERSDCLSYDPLYILKYADPAYVDISEMEMDRFVNIVTAAKGIATYNIRAQRDFDVKGENYIAGMNYEMPVYNVDDKSDYYLAIPDVNMFNSSFRAYDIDVAYNNDFAEMISGYKYKKGILYIPKSAIDHPKNKSSVPEGALIAVQMNYAIGGDMDFTKSIPVQVLRKDEPVEKTVHTANLFEQGITVKTGVRNRKADDISVFLNGHMIPVNDGSWIYDKSSGELYIHEMPGAVSNINIVFRNRTALEAVKDAALSLLERSAFESYAEGVSTDEMEFFRTTEGEEVVLNISGGELFTGWRGHYTAAKVIHGRQGSQTHEEAEAAKKKLKGWANSVLYLYGGYTDLGGAGTSLIDSNAGKREFDARIAATWAVSSYALGADAGLMNDDGTLTKDMLVTHNVPVTEGETTTYNTTEQHTIYEWLMIYQNQLKKSNGATSNNHNNGIAGATNFAVTFPDSIQGSSLSLVSEGENEGRSNDSITITSDNMDSSYYIAASCNHLDDVAASDKDTDIYVTCLALGSDYAVLAFAQARGGQNASAIYKFRLQGQYKTTVHKTDASGGELEGAVLQILSGDTVIKEWTSGAEAEVFEDIEPGTYTLREISAPYGYDLADDQEFTASAGGDTEITMRNTPVTVATSAVSAATGMRMGTSKSNEKITDTVHMTGLVKNREYRLTAQLMNRQTGSAIDGAASVRDFTATADTMDVTVDITFDSSALTDSDSVVVFETLYRTSAVHSETVPAELGKHNDINDAAQTVYIPRIGTEAAISDDSTVITDTVAYGNLLTGQRYVFRGWLVDTASGTKIPGSDGETALNAAADTSGSVEVRMDASGFDDISGSSITAYEELYIVVSENGTDKEIKIAEHKDRSGSAATNPQTVGICHDLKIKKNVTGNLGDLTKVFEYTAEFTGLVPGQAYRIEGDDEKTFMADQSGNASALIKLKDGQTAVIKELPKGASYKVTEAASDHVAEYRMFSEDMADKGAKIIRSEDSNGEDAARPLTTAAETVDLLDGTVVILWENNRDLATLTGVITYTGIRAAALAAVLACMAAMVIYRRRYAAEWREK